MYNLNNNKKNALHIRLFTIRIFAKFYFFAMITNNYLYAIGQLLFNCTDSVSDYKSVSSWTSSKWVAKLMDCGEISSWRGFESAPSSIAVEVKMGLSVGKFTR